MESDSLWKNAYSHDQNDAKFCEAVERIHGNSFWWLRLLKKKEIDRFLDPSTERSVLTLRIEFLDLPVEYATFLHLLYVISIPTRILRCRFGTRSFRHVHFLMKFNLMFTIFTLWTEISQGQLGSSGVNFRSRIEILQNTLLTVPQILRNKKQVYIRCWWRHEHIWECCWWNFTKHGDVRLYCFVKSV